MRRPTTTHRDDRERAAARKTVRRHQDQRTVQRKIFRGCVTTRSRASAPTRIANCCCPGVKIPPEGRSRTSRATRGTRLRTRCLAVEDSGPTDFERLNGGTAALKLARPGRLCRCIRHETGANDQHTRHAEPTHCMLLEIRCEGYPRNRAAFRRHVLEGPGRRAYGGRRMLRHY